MEPDKTLKEDWATAFEKEGHENPHACADKLTQIARETMQAEADKLAPDSAMSARIWQKIIARQNALPAKKRWWPINTWMQWGSLAGGLACVLLALFVLRPVAVEQTRDDWEIVASKGDAFTLVVDHPEEVLAAFGKAADSAGIVWQSSKEADGVRLSIKQLSGQGAALDAWAKSWQLTLPDSGNYQILILQKKP